MTGSFDFADPFNIFSNYSHEHDEIIPTYYIAPEHIATDDITFAPNCPITTVPAELESSQESDEAFVCPCCGLASDDAISYHSHVSTCYLQHYSPKTIPLLSPVASPISSTSSCATAIPPVESVIDRVKATVQSLNTEQRTQLMQAFFKMSQALETKEEKKIESVDTKVINLLYSPPATPMSISSRHLSPTASQFSCSELESSDVWCPTDSSPEQSPISDKDQSWAYELTHVSAPLAAPVDSSFIDSPQALLRHHRCTKRTRLSKNIFHTNPYQFTTLDDTEPISKKHRSNLSTEEPFQFHI